MLSPIKKYLLLVLSVLLVLCASGCGTGHETEKKLLNRRNLRQQARRIMLIPVKLHKMFLWLPSMVKK